MILLMYSVLRLSEEMFRWLLTPKVKFKKEKSPKGQERQTSSSSSSTESVKPCSKELNLDVRSSSVQLKRPNIPESIWLTKTGHHFHVDPHCRSLKNTKYVTERKTLCGHCANKTLSRSGI